jgi:PST family polysaccharide transporter
MGRYLPALALSMLLDRLWFVPERALMRDMRFRPVAAARSAGELAYTVVSCTTALLGWGGMAIAAGSVARSAARAVITLSAVDRRDWLEPSRLRRDATLDLFRFSLPLAVGIIAAFVASKWDNLFVSSFFGPAVMAAYNVAYNLAGIASGLVGEHVNDVLVPSFARAGERQRGEGFLRSAALVALVSTPLCVGLAAVAPTVVATFLDVRWAAVAPMLAVLSAVATLGPLEGLIFAYLQGCGRPWLTMSVQVVALVGLFGALLTVGRLGPLWACSAVGIGALLCVLASFVVIRTVDAIPLPRLVGTQVGPILAALPMFAAVLGARWIWARFGLGTPALGLAAEICAGGLAYCGASALCSREAARDLVGLVQGAYLRRRASARGQVVLGSTTDS